MWSRGMGGQAYWPGQQPHVEEPTQEQAHEQAHEQVDPTQSRRPRARGRNAIDPKLVGPVPGGPEIPDLLFSFTAHTAYFIYQGIVSYQNLSLLLNYCFFMYLTCSFYRSDQL